jgi:hypothetical protein
MPPFPLRGSGGADLEAFWAKERLQAYEGVSVPGFPNFFSILGPLRVQRRVLLHADREPVAPHRAVPDAGARDRGDPRGGLRRGQRPLLRRGPRAAPPPGLLPGDVRDVELVLLRRARRRAVPAVEHGRGGVAQRALPAGGTTASSGSPPERCRSSPSTSSRRSCVRRAGARRSSGRGRGAGPGRASRPTGPGCAGARRPTATTATRRARGAASGWPRTPRRTRTWRRRSRSRGSATTCSPGRSARRAATAGKGSNSSSSGSAWRRRRSASPTSSWRATASTSPRARWSIPPVGCARGTSRWRRSTSPTIPARPDPRRGGPAAGTAVTPRQPAS